MYRTEDWWTYEICPGRHVRQFHQQGKTLMAQYWLGKINANATKVRPNRRLDIHRTQILLECCSTQLLIMQSSDMP